MILRRSGTSIRPFAPTLPYWHLVIEIDRMTDWASPSRYKIPAKVHRNVSLIRTSDAILAEELLARPKLARHIVGRLTPDTLLIHPGAANEVVEELKRMGHTPRVEGAK